MSRSDQTTGETCPTCGRPPPPSPGAAYITIVPELLERVRVLVDAEGIDAAGARLGVSGHTVRKVLRSQPVRRGTALLVALRASSLDTPAAEAPL